MLIVGLALGGLICYFVLLPKVKNTDKVNEEIQQQNNELSSQKTRLQDSVARLQEQLGNLNLSRTQLVADIASAQTKREELEEHIEDLRKRSEEDIEKLYQKDKELMRERLKAEEDRYQKSKEDYQKEYLTMLEDLAGEYAKIQSQKSQELEEVQKQLDSFRAKAAAEVEAARREEEKQLNLDKYRILLDEIDVVEINRLREIIPYFRTPRPLCKAIWEQYYRNRANDMINRVIGSGEHTGIYKITSIKDGKVYIGQAVNLRNRWLEHLKCACGIDTPNNVLYKAMQEEHVENFTFEVLEECKREELNDREKYYISFYDSQNWGYNMNAGGARI